MPKVKKVVLAGLLLAILIIFERLVPLQITDFLRLSFSYVPLVLAGTLLGPGWAAVIGVAGDILGMLLWPKGAYFPGFTLSALLTGLLYGLFLYDKKGQMPPKSYLARLILSTIAVHVFVRLGLTTLWLVILYKRAFMVVLAGRLIANLAEIPLEIASMFAIKIFLDKPIKKYLLEDSEPDTD